METDEIAAFVFLDIAAIVVVARLVGALFRKIRQPAVVGEIIAGILLGPTLLGRLPGDLTEDLFPREVRPFLSIVAQLGLIIFMFIVGMELDLKLIRGHERSAAVISLSSVILPFALGCLLASGIYDSHKTVGGDTVKFTAFALFMGASMSVTAFPVLARILTERGMYRTPIGTLALASAAVDDILAWSMLAVVVAVVESTGVWDLPRILLLSVGFVTFMFLVVKPQLARLNERYKQAERLTPGILSVVLVGVLLSSFITSKIGIHSIFGAFLFGAMMPRENAEDLMHEILERLEQVSVLLLLPVFFIATGLGVDVGGIGLRGAAELALILFVACAGKLVGATAAARFQKVPIRKAAAVGVLMNTRGLTELVILNIGLSKGVLDEQLFTMLVVMAVFTTVITEPLLRVVYSERMLARDIAEAERARLGVVDAYRVLVAIRDPSRDSAVVGTAVALVGPERPAEIVLTRLLPATRSRLEVGSGLSAELSQMTGSFAEMESLAEVARARGVPCVVLSRFTDDLARELAEQAGSVDADVVLLSRSDGDTEVVDEVLRRVPSQVVVMAGADSVAPVGGSTIVVASGGKQAQAALEISFRTARGDHTPLIVISGDRRTGSRRLRQAVEVLRRHGVECSVIDAPGDPAVELARHVDGASMVVAGTDLMLANIAGDHVAVLAVRPADDSDGAEFDRLLAKLETKRIEGERMEHERQGL